MLSYRLCDPSDFKIWTELNREFMDEEIQDADLWNNADKVSDEQFHQTFEVALASKEMISLLLFEVDGKTVGFANLMIVFSVWSHGHALVIDDLYFRAEHRGKGLGREALDLIEDFAKEKSCKRLQFQSELTNPNAMEFYKAVGYTPSDMKFYVKYL